MSDIEPSVPWFSCPLPGRPDADRITLEYGEGGRLMRQFIRDRIVPRFHHEPFNSQGDAAILPTAGQHLAFTTDAYTVTPLFFSGGDIGRLAVFGTINDLAVSGAIPRWISLSLIIEEGLEWSLLDRVLDSIQAATLESKVTVVTGDTKVVPRGAADQLFITTSGIGEMGTAMSTGPASLQADDVLIVSGPIGRHGAAILCSRDDLGFEPLPVSDCATVAEPLLALYRENQIPRAVRDATRGGVSAVLHEWAEACRLTCVIDEAALPITSDVRAVCELLGLDPLHLANEGTFVLATPPALVESTLRCLARFDVSRRATVFGRITQQRIAPVAVVRSFGREVALDDPLGAPLPRIC